MSVERFLVIHPDGREEEAARDLRAGSAGFQCMLRKEALKENYRPLDAEPAYLEMCRHLGIAWEEMSDSGHMRYGPAGALVFDLMADYNNQVVRDLGLPLCQVKGTNMFNLNEEPVAEHAGLFGDRLYTVKDPDSGSAYVLRYAACHQQFAMLRHWQISHKHLPFAAYELADSYRLEQSGECMLGFRTRRLNMPDLHVLCRDQVEARQWFMNIHARIMAEAKVFGQDYELLVNLSSPAAYAADKPLLLELSRAENKPLLVHIYPGDRNYYWTVNLEYHIIDAMERAREIGTVQIDVGNAERFGITYTGRDGKKRHPVILHTAIIGTVERFMYMVFDRQVKQGGVKLLPYWLSPEQLRLLPVSGDYLPHCLELASRFEKAGVRAGLDDRAEKVAKKVRDAHAGWLPYYTVVGERESGGRNLHLADRARSGEQLIGMESAIARLRNDQGDYPWRPLYFPAQLSRRPQF